jgi:hypothetical protein
MTSRRGICRYIYSYFQGLYLARLYRERRQGAYPVFDRVGVIVVIFYKNTLFYNFSRSYEVVNILA